VGDGPRAVKAVGAENPVGAEEGQEEEQEENVVERHHEQPQYRGWDYDQVDPRYVRSPAPTPELEAEPERAPRGRNQFVTRSGRHWGLISTATNDYEAELDDYLGRPGKDEYHPSNARIPLWTGYFSPHSLAAFASQAVGAVEPRSWREAVNSIDAERQLSPAPIGPQRSV